jgi:hypothetical protein
MKAFTKRRADLLRFLARVDQSVAEAESLLSEPVLTDTERALVRLHLVTRQRARERVEALIAECQ